MRENIKIQTLLDVLSGELPVNTIVGNRKENGVFFVAFVRTDYVTGEVVAETDKVSLNWKPSKRQQF